MKELKGRVAVVTGGASGIGRALAERFAAEGMKLVLADIEPASLEKAVGELTATGAEAIGVVTDVARGEQVEALARRAESAFGKVHVLCNNAGVAAGGPSWKLTHADWDWVVGVNLWGVIHGVRHFLPAMLAHGEEGHVVNTASIAGLAAPPFMATYTATKFAVVGLSESLHHELALTGQKVGVSVLCPGWVMTRISESERNRPAALANEKGPDAADPGAQLMAAAVSRLVAGGKPPAEIAGAVVDAIVSGRFWILTHPELTGALRDRAAAMVEGVNPRFNPAGLGVG